MSIRVVIVYHSGTGHTEAIARSVLRGAGSVEGVEVEMISVEELGAPSEDAGSAWAKLSGASAIVFGSPTFMGTVSAQFKAFMDLTGAIWFSRGWMDKLAAGFTVAGSPAGDKQGTLQAMHTFASQHGMIWVSVGVGVGEKDIDRLGCSTGLMAQADNGPPEVTPPEGDHRTAERFGERVARATARWDGGGE